MNRKYQVTILLVVIILAGFLFASVSNAQTPPPPPTVTPPPPASTSSAVTLNPADLVAANSNQGLCEGAFRTSVQSYGTKIGLSITTEFTPTKSFGKTLFPSVCHIVSDPANSKDSVSAGLLESQLKNASGPISSDGAQKAAQNFPAGESAWYERLVGFILSGLYTVIASVLGFLASLAGEILGWVIKWTTNASEPKIVGQGWLIIRDFMNLFFIFGLIVIGLATILRLEAYNYKKLLVQLILMALLINFSKVIATTIISFFDVLINVIKGDGAFFDIGSFTYTITHPGGTADGLFGGGVISQVVTSYSAMFVGAIAIIAFLVLSAMFFIRMVGLWFLIMVSPAAYALNILPQTKGLAQRWWSTFFKYLIWGPVSLLFIKLGNSLIQVRATEPLLKSNEMFGFVFIGIFFWASILMVKQAGMIGSAAIMGVANKTISQAKGWEKGIRSYQARGTYAKHVGAGIGAGVTRAGLMVGDNKYGKAIQKMGGNIKKGGEKTGNFIGTTTAKMQSYPKYWQERFAIGNRARDKQLKDEKLNQLVNSGVKLDKDVYSQLGAKHIMMMAKNIAPDQVADIIEHKGRQGADTLMLAMKDGMLDAVEKSDDKKAIKSAVTKAYFKDRGIKEFEFDQNAEKYIALADRAEVVQTGALKPGPDGKPVVFSVQLKNEDGSFQKDEHGNILEDQTQGIKYTKKFSTDNRKISVVVPTKENLENLSVDDIETMSLEDLKKTQRKQKKQRAAQTEAGQEAEASAHTEPNPPDVSNTPRTNNGNSGSPELS
jgi:hypothetical protein